MQDASICSEESSPPTTGLVGLPRDCEFWLRLWRHFAGTAIGHWRPGNLTWVWLAILVETTVLAVLLVELFETARGKTTVESCSRGVLRVSIPCHAVHSGDGALKLQVLDPVDRVLGRTKTKVAVGKGAGPWQKDVRPDMALVVTSTSHCPYCIGIRASKARELGAADQEIADVVFIAAALRAGGRSPTACTV